MKKKAYFENKLKGKIHNCGRHITLTRDLVYYSKIMESYIIVPKGFCSDFATVPRFLWGIYPPQGKYSRAAVLHDYLLECPQYSDLLADRIFWEACRASDVIKISSAFLYAGVTIGTIWRSTGISAYRRARKRTIKEEGII